MCNLLKKNKFWVSSPARCSEGNCEFIKTKLNLHIKWSILWIVYENLFVAHTVLHLLRFSLTFVDNSSFSTTHTVCGQFSTFLKTFYLTPFGISLAN